MGAKTPEGVLRHSGPMLSSSILDALRKGGASPEAARKRLQRSVTSGVIRSLLGVRFPHNERFHYLEEDFGGHEYFARLLGVMRDSGSVYGTAISSMSARGGRVPEDHFRVISGSPTKLRGHVASDGVLRALENTNILVRAADPALGDVISFGRRVRLPVIPAAEMRARLIAESVLLNALVDWLRKNGFVSYNAPRLRPPLGKGDTPEFAHFHWDLTAPCYLNPLAFRSSAGVKPGFVVADVVLGTELGETGIRYFLNKGALVRAQRGVRPTLAILVASGFKPEALQLARSAGYVVTTPANLFGSEIAEALEGLIGVLSNAAAAVAADPARVDRLITELSRIEGAAINLRGPLFEMIVGMIAKEDGGHIEMGKRITVPGTAEMAEVDVLRVRGKSEIWAYECKGKERGGIVSEQEVERWLTRQVARINDWIASEQRFSGHRFHACFSTSATLSDGAIALLESTRAKTQRYELHWMDGEDVYRAAANLNDGYAKKLLNEHFRP